MGFGELTDDPVPQVQGAFAWMEVVR
jgi:hypothetical protein